MVELYISAFSTSIVKQLITEQDLLVFQTIDYEELGEVRRTIDTNFLL